MGNYPRVDSTADKHHVLMCDEAGEELVAATFARDEAGLRSLYRTLVGLRVELVAIERPDGLLVERLLDVGLRLLPLHPNQVAATRAADEILPVARPQDAARRSPTPSWWPGRGSDPVGHPQRRRFLAVRPASALAPVPRICPRSRTNYNKRMCAPSPQIVSLLNSIARLSPSWCDGVKAA